MVHINITNKITLENPPACFCSDCRFPVARKNQRDNSSPHSGNSPHSKDRCSRPDSHRNHNSRNHNLEREGRSMEYIREYQAKHLLKENTTGNESGRQLHSVPHNLKESAAINRENTRI